MIALEKRLIERGYEKYCYDTKQEKYYKPDSHIISTMVNIDHRYVKDNNFDNQIVIGLSEYQKPVTLISHRKKFVIGNDVVTSDDQMNRLMQGKGVDYIIDIIEKK